MRNALGKRSPLHRWLRRALLLAPVALIVAACGDRPKFTFSDAAPIAGGTVGIGGSIISGGVATGGVATDPCAFPLVGKAPIFSGQLVTNGAPARPSLYAEVTDAEATLLRAGGSLLPAPGTSSNPTFTTVLMNARTTSFGSELSLLQAVAQRFRSTRALWPNAWALRLVDHPGSEHMNPVRVTFKNTALFLELSGPGDNLTVVDINNATVPTDTAAAAPERIAAVFYLYNQLTGTGATCDTGKRELVLGNEAMVETITLGTQDILTRLDADIDALDAFFNVARPCAKLDTSGESFRAFTTCTTWMGATSVFSELNAYQWALSTPAELYKPSAQNLASLIQALKDDRFDVDPYIGVPPPVVVGAGGAGGASGAGGESGFGGAP